MAYLATFHWGWLTASGLLGLAMGWIAVVPALGALSRFSTGTLVVTDRQIKL